MKNKKKKKSTGPPTVPPLPGGEERGEGELKALADYLTIMPDWGTSDWRRRALIEALKELVYMEEALPRRGL